MENCEIIIGENIVVDMPTKINFFDSNLLAFEVNINDMGYEDIKEWFDVIDYEDREDYDSLKKDMILSYYDNRGLIHEKIILKLALPIDFNVKTNIVSFFYTEGHKYYLDQKINI